MSPLISHPLIFAGAGFVLALAVDWLSQRITARLAYRARIARRIAEIAKEV